MVGFFSFLYVPEFYFEAQQLALRSWLAYFASSGALHYAKIFASLKTKMYTSYIIEQRPERLYFPFERIFESISRMIVKVGFNGISRMLCLSIGTSVYMDMTGCRPENPQKALLCSPPVRFFAGEEQA